MDNGKSQQDKARATTNSSSFICSLADDELIEFINKLSQDKKLAEARRKEEFETDVDTDPDTGADTEDDSQAVAAPVSAVLSSSKKPMDNAEVNPIKTVSETVLLASDEPVINRDNLLGSITLAQQGTQKNSGEEKVEELAFGDYETYFKEKKLKQAQADADFKIWDEERRRKQGITEFTYPPIFRGCTIHVNGRTDPDISQLHKMIVLHGGTFLHYLGAKGNATHIIASKLTPRKHIEFRNYKVVKADWIVDSIAQRKLLSWMDYAIINNDFGQQKLNFAAKQAPLEDDIGEEKVEKEFELAPLTQEDDDPKEAAAEVEIESDERGIVDSKNPDFLKYFFSKSRLHHLSTWKSDLKYEFLQKALAKQVSTKGAQKAPRKAMVEGRTIFHIDFDCFFATASALSTVDVDISKDPIAVSHGGGSADVASCNYVARNYGVRNGMWMRQAKKLCPNLICLDYNFREYERISRIFYDYMIDLNCDSVLPVSVDELLLDVTTLCHHHDPIKTEEVARQIKADIYDRTKCTVSIGAASNVLLAKLALRKSKPDGFFQVLKTDDVGSFLKDISLRDLPGVGYSISSKLENVFGAQRLTVGFLKTIDKQKLINIFGIKTGNKLYDYARGIDDTDIDISNNPGEYVRKSVSIDINWGIRFDNIHEVDAFMLNCAKEMHSRLLKIKMTGSSVTLKLARRAPGAPIEPPKYLGMGECNFFSKSARLGVATREIGLISSECKALYRFMNVPPVELRGVSVQITHLVDDGVAEKALANQRQLPFSKIAKDQFLVENNKPLKNNNKVVEVSSSPTSLPPRPPHPLSPPPVPAHELIPKSDEVSQYDIPSDVDSSMLKILPEDMREAIEKKRAQKQEPISAVPAQSQIDWEVFKTLPREIQRELRDELKRRDIPVLDKPSRQSPSKNRKTSPTGKFHLQPVFAKTDDEPKMVRVISPSKHASPRKRSRPINRDTTIDLQMLDIDEEVLDELPSFVRRDLISDLKYQLEMKSSRDANQKLHDQLQADVDRDLELAGQSKRRRIQLTKRLFDEMTDYKTRPVFHGQESFNGVKTVLQRWVEGTITNGPTEEDVVQFTSFVTKLLEVSIADCISYLRVMKCSVEIERKLARLGEADSGVAKWQHYYERLRILIDNKCFEANITYS